MSPQYTNKSAASATAAHQTSSSKTRDMLRGEDPRFRSLDRILARELLRRLQFRAQQQRSAAYYMPRMDVCDDPDHTYITAVLELPGMKREQLSTRVENGTFIVEGERTGPHLHARPRAEDLSSEPTSSTLYPVQEIKYGRFRRQWPLPEGVTEADVRSTLQHGMLTVTWPRNPRVQPGRSAHAEPPAAQTDVEERGGHEVDAA
ncbi:HSP20-like chaperone [Trametes sanguinea]|nr:HSP20-like chaperone [Trametes sanguinea]